MDEIKRIAKQIEDESTESTVDRFGHDSTVKKGAKK